MAECVYIIHFNQPYKHAKHYVGWTGMFEERMWHHRNGTGANLLKVLLQNGIDWVVSRTFDGQDRHFERKLHNAHKTAKYCPICNPGAPEYKPREE